MGRLIGKDAARAGGQEQGWISITSEDLPRTSMSGRNWTLDCRLRRFMPFPMTPFQRCSGLDLRAHGLVAIESDFASIARGGHDGFDPFADRGEAARPG